LGKSSCSNIILEVCEAIWQGLADYIKQPNQEEFKEIAERFFVRWNFPHCIGAVDGKHIKLKAPPNSGSKHFNYKQTHSIVLMATCDGDYCFTMVDIGAEGSQSDSGVFRNSQFGQQIKDRTLPEPPACNLPGTDDTKFPFFYVGDEAFALTENFMIPYGKALVAGLGEAQIRRKIFNYRLSRARRIIENAFGILTAKWRIFHTPIQATNENAKLYVQACVALHNYLLKTKNQGVQRSRAPGPTENIYSAAPQENPYLSTVRVVSNKNALAKHKQLRDTLCDYVNDVNALDYQRNYVLRGHNQVMQNIHNIMQ
jgi:DDE superfamily endonuclease